jgi:hypothetical protein
MQTSPPGESIGLLATAAAIMSIRPEMTFPEKVCWSIVLGIFLVAEFQSIHADRDKSDKQATADRKTQDDEFGKVLDAQRLAFEATARSLNAAIGGINSTLQASNTTLQQTAPHAALIFDRFEFAPPPPANITAKVPYRFNFHYTNEGAETATGEDFLIESYIGKADNKDDQIALAKKFDADWGHGNRTGSRRTVTEPNLPSFGSIERTFTGDELPASLQYWTIYYFMRVEWSDKTGRWRTDSCGGFQRSSPQRIDINIGHPCATFTRFRYPVKTR